MRGQLEFSSKILSEEGKDLIRKMLCYNQNKRINPVQVIGYLGFSKSKIEYYINEINEIIELLTNENIETLKKRRTRALKMIKMILRGAKAK